MRELWRCVLISAWIWLKMQIIRTSELEGVEAEPKVRPVNTRDEIPCALPRLTEVDERVGRE